MEDTYWSQIEWEILSEQMEIKAPFNDSDFVQAFDFSTTALDRIQVYRDDEYCLKAIATGDYVQGEHDRPDDGTLIEKSVLYGTWQHCWQVKLVNCLQKNMTQEFDLVRNRKDVTCALSMNRLKIKPMKGMPKQKRASLVEWYLNAPGSTVLYTDLTERKLTSKLVRKRDHYKDVYAPQKQANYSSDTVYIAVEDTGCYISKVSEKYEPDWAAKLSIEYRKEFGYIPDRVTREAVCELAGFLMGRDLKLIGHTSYTKNGQVVRAMAQNPQSVNIRKVCQLPEQEIVPVHIYGDEGDNFKNMMEQLLPIYLHSPMRAVIHSTLPLYWSSFILYVDNAIPIIASAVEALQKAWFKMDEHKSKAVYYPKAEFKAVRKQIIDILDDGLPESEYKNVVKNKVDQLNQMSVRDRNEFFFTQLGIEYGNREVTAIQMRNAFAHGDSVAADQTNQMIDSLKILQLIYAKVVLKLLGYEGEYIDWTVQGHPRKRL